MFTVKLHDEAKKELLSIPVELQGKFTSLIDKLEKYGQLKMPNSKSLGGGLFELRVIERNNIARAIYVYQKQNIIFLLHAFVKKSQKTPSSAIKTAQTRVKDII